MKNDLLDLYSDYLIASFGATAATGLAALLNGDVSHVQITRFLASQARTSAATAGRGRAQRFTRGGIDGLNAVGLGCSGSGRECDTFAR